ncbi:MULTISPECIES: DUF3060 domain-containing protein [unclassified Mycobacterium]|uniref:DUF3060 domain-containing protein n=1 Tax=unclassified Mycobacterium TaxID=2642494 RepID=UPI0009EE942D|nr:MULTISPECIES: DUF3060 domain-containing protein [unclassified Mycobacterium]
MAGAPNSMMAVLASIALASGPAAAAAPVPLDLAPAKIDVSVATVTYDCGAQSPIRIVGQDSTITLTGSCGEVDVTGIANTVNLPKVAVINVSGTGNHVTWEQGPGGGALPRISNPGGANDIRGPGGIQIQAGRG